MGIRTEEYSGVCVVAVEGGLAGDAAREARRAVDEVMARRGAVGVVFDLGACESVDSAGLEMLCQVRRRCEDAGARVALARVGATWAKVLEITRLVGRFECHAELERAVAAAR